MTFDEELRKRFDTLTDRLRDEVARQLGEVSADLTASVKSECAASAARAADQARQDAERKADEVRQELERKVEEAREEANRRAEDVREETERMVASERQEAERKTEEVRQQLERKAEEAREEANRRAEEAREETERSVVAMRQEAERQAGERLIAGVAAAEVQGRAQARDEQRAGELARSERLADAIRAIDQARSLSEILDTLIGCAGREAARVGVLLVQGNELRGWRFSGFRSPLDEGSHLRLPAIDAGVIRDAVRTVAAQSADSAVYESMPSFAELPPGREMLAVPLPLGGRVVAVLYADQGTGEANDSDLRAAWSATLEVMARHAARCLEAITTFRAAQVLADRRGVPPSFAATGDHAASRSADEGADEVQAARRYARLLISEIKLYHEADVAAGRRDRDLAARLGGEIAHARVLFEHRVPAAVRQTGEYFHAELVRTLANGDPALLGTEKLEGRS